MGILERVCFHRFDFHFKNFMFVGLPNIFYFSLIYEYFMEGFILLFYYLFYIFRYKSIFGSRFIYFFIFLRVILNEGELLQHQFKNRLILKIIFMLRDIFYKNTSEVLIELHSKSLFSIFKEYSLTSTLFHTKILKLIINSFSNKK